MRIIPDKPTPNMLIFDGQASIEMLANNAEPYNGGSKFFIEGEAIRPGTYRACNMDHPIYYPPDIMNAIAEQLEGQSIRYHHSEMTKLSNQDLNKIGVVTDTKVMPDGRVLYHGFISKHRYQAFMAAMVDERHVNPKDIPSFDEFTQLIANRTLGGSSVSVKVDGRWENGAYTASNPNTRELSVVPKGACPTSSARPANTEPHRWGILAMNSAVTPEGVSVLAINEASNTPGAKIIKVEQPTNGIETGKQSITIDSVGVLAGLARNGIDAVDVSNASEEELMAIMHFVDGFKAKAYTRLHGTKPADNSQGEAIKQEEGANNRGDITWQTTNQKVTRVTLK